ncbi:3-hydroxymyristoyl/3-hydroxydecanoyl-(acyl carrier protein) dehydratase [Tsukamurella ocularis]|nr:3-hydroxymyristoyl/3-hydroxydecanoyl-(acyl carrier protein) dehydratase [Tsukamurella ocularis]MCS3789936.1 3-hydroxymyristoyl/3-hydroxydecanoyl-(acyl carrier protein) dehydratase [Tsukamurella ocularis]MCS3852433.1 3-hydroxymyristoyl/3-hydroxydecanoyl-(acyl carrier protein) dehydratase [Tsukamurella ocularis]
MTSSSVLRTGMPIGASIRRTSVGRMEIGFPSAAAPYESHFPGYPVIPAVSLLAAVVTAVQADLPSHSHLSELGPTVFRAPVIPGAVLNASVNTDPVNEWTDFRLQTGVNSRSVVRGTLKIAERSRLSALEEPQQAGSANATPSNAIYSRLPHRPPMLLISAWSEEAEITTDTVPVVGSPSEVRLLMLEAWAQAACLQLNTEKGSLPVIASIEFARWTAPTDSGSREQQWRHQIEDARDLPSTGMKRVEGRVELAGRSILEAAVVVAARPVI